MIRFMSIASCVMSIVFGTDVVRDNHAPLSVEDILTVQSSDTPLKLFENIARVTNDDQTASLYRNFGYFDDVYKGTQYMQGSDIGSVAYNQGQLTRNNGLLGIWGHRVSYPYTSTILSYHDYLTDPNQVNLDTLNANILSDVFDVSVEDGIIYKYMNYLRLRSLVSKARNQYLLSFM